MGSFKLNTVRDSYDHVWTTTSFSNVHHVCSLVEQLSEDEFVAFCEGSLPAGRKDNLVTQAARKNHFFPHPCATCAPFAILVAKEVLTRLHGRANVDIVFLRTNSHGATVLIDTDGSHCLIDSSLGTAHVLEENKWFYKTNKTQNAIVAASPPRLPHNVSELVHCKFLRQIPASTSHSSTSHGDISQPLKLRCFAKKSPKSSNFKEVSQEELLEWSLRDAIRQPSIVFLGRTQSNRQNVFTHYLKVDLQTAEVTLPFKTFKSNRIACLFEDGVYDVFQENLRDLLVACPTSFTKEDFKLLTALVRRRLSSKYEHLCQSLPSVKSSRICRSF